MTQAPGTSCPEFAEGALLTAPRGVGSALLPTPRPSSRRLCPRHPRPRSPGVPKAESAGGAPGGRGREATRGAQRAREPSGVGPTGPGARAQREPAEPPPPAAAESSAPRRRPRARVSHARTPNWARPARGAHAAGGASRGLCVQTAQWAAAVGGAAGGA